MPGRKPHRLKLRKDEIPILEHLAQRRVLPYFQVERARALLALATGESPVVLAERLECHPATIWRLARRYESEGLESIFSEEPRPVRPLTISPLGPGRDRKAGTLGTDCAGTVDCTLDKRRSGVRGHPRQHRAKR
jgi:hypothetical protein